MKQLAAFVRGIAEFRRSFTTRCAEDSAYETGREFAHRLTFRRFES